MTKTTASGSGLTLTIPWWHMMVGAHLQRLDADARNKEATS